MSNIESPEDAPMEEKETTSETPIKPVKNETPARLRTIFEIDIQKRTIKLLNQKCPRCGAIMAHHRIPIERWTCGSCSYTDFLKKD